MNVEGSHLKVPATLQNAGHRVSTDASTIIGALETLGNQLRPLQDSWTGDAYTYFNLLQQEWNVSALGLFGDGVTHPGLLGNIAAALDAAWYNYVTGQNANTRTWIV
jgi:hypothetical protein